MSQRELREHAAALARMKDDPAERLLWYVTMSERLTTVDFEEIEACLSELGWLASEPPDA
jgi:hypothetical protein